MRLRVRTTLKRDPPPTVRIPPTHHHPCNQRPHQRSSAIPTNTQSRPYHRTPTATTDKNQKRNKARYERRKKKKKMNSVATKKDLRILQHNVNGLKSRKVETEHRLAKLKIDIAALQECNFSVKKKKKQSDPDEHVFPKLKGYILEASPRKIGRKAGTGSQGRGGVAFAIKEGINYERLSTPPVIPTDLTTEWIGIRVFPPDNSEPLELWNLYVPPIHNGDKDDDRIQCFDTTCLPTAPNTFLFGDANCHGSWDDRLNNTEMSDKWDDWANNNFCVFLNDLNSYTRQDTRGKKSSPDISVVPQLWLSKVTWRATYNDPSGSDHIPLLTVVSTQASGSRRSRKKRQDRVRWAAKKADWNLFRMKQDEYLADLTAHHPTRRDDHQRALLPPHQSLVRCRYRCHSTR